MKHVLNTLIRFVDFVHVKIVFCRLWLETEWERRKMMRRYRNKIAR